MKTDPVDLSFLESAPLHIRCERVVNAPPEAVWKVLVDAEGMPKWFPDAVKCEWTSPAPYGVGSTRTFTQTNNQTQERYLAWEENRRQVYATEAIKLPVVSQLLEEMKLTPVEGAKTRVEFTCAFRPTLFAWLLVPVLKVIFGGMFRKSLEGLARVAEETKGATGG